MSELLSVLFVLALVTGPLASTAMIVCATRAKSTARMAAWLIAAGLTLLAYFLLDGPFLTEFAWHVATRGIGH